MTKDLLFLNVFNNLHDDDLLSYKYLCDLKKDVKYFYLTRSGSNLFNLYTDKYLFDFNHFFVDYDYDEYELMFAFDILFKWWFAYSFDKDGFVSFLNDFYNFWRLKIYGKED